MASTNKTENYGLNQWVKTDPVLMEDFNADNQKIDQALAGILGSMARFEKGSYVGDDNYGRNTPNTLSFDFEPKLLMINGYCIVAGTDDIVTGGGSAYLTWNGGNVSWYSLQSASCQLNSSATTYNYLAIG